jgi:hypothetical protein
MEEGAEFAESFIINKSITLTADGANASVIKSSKALTSSRSRMQTMSPFLT